MASLTFLQAKQLLAQYVTSQGPADPTVGFAINFVNERFITSGQWKGNRFIKSFSVSQDSAGNSYFDTTTGVESVLKVIAVDSVQNGSGGEIADVMSDWFPWVEGGLGYLPADYVGDTQIIRQGQVPANGDPSLQTADTQRYRVIGKSPENRSMYCIVRRAYVPLINDNDLLVPSNRNAYRYGVQAYIYDNNNDLERAATYWTMAYTCLNDETMSFEDGVQSQVDIQTKAFAPSGIQNLI